MNAVWIKLLSVALGLGVLWAAVDRFHQAGLVRDLKRDRAACAAAAQSPDMPLTKCPALVADRVDQARRADACEAALKGNDLYAIRASCGEQGKRIAAELVAASASLADARAQIDQADARTAQAVARAEARGLSQADRISKNDRTIDAAPRGADGNVRCDAECLRALGGYPASRP